MSIYSLFQIQNLCQFNDFGFEFPFLSPQLIIRQFGSKVSNQNLLPNAIASRATIQKDLLHKFQNGRSTVKSM